MFQLNYIPYYNLNQEQKQFRSFSIWSTLLLLVSTLVGYYVLNTLFEGAYFKAFPFLCAFFYAASLAFYYFLAKARAKDENYAQIFLALSGGKFIVYITASLIFIFFHRDMPVPVAASVFGLYILHQVLELYFLMKHSRGRNG